MNQWREDIGEFHYRPEGRSYCIREAITLRELDEVHRITHDSIVAAGYMRVQPSGRLVNYPALDSSPLTTIFLAMESDALIGTHSVTADGRLGLPTDRMFGRETDAIRAEGRHVVSFFRLATDPTRGKAMSSALVLDLVKCAFVAAIDRYDFDTMVCAFNPKHAGLYQRLLAARMIARVERVDNGEIDAGAVMMRVDRERIPAPFAASIRRTAARWARADAASRIAGPSTTQPPPSANHVDGAA